MEPKNKLLCNAKNTISDEELQRFFAEPDYHIFHTEVEKLVESGVLVPIKSFKTMLKLYDLQIIDLKKWKAQQEDVVANATGELDVSYCLYRIEYTQPHWEECCFCPHLGKDCNSG